MKIVPIKSLASWCRERDLRSKAFQPLALSPRLVLCFTDFVLIIAYLNHSPSLDYMEISVIRLPRVLELENRTCSQEGSHRSLISLIY